MLTVDWNAAYVILAFLSAGVGIVAWAVRAEGRSKANAVMADEAKKRADDAHIEISEFRERAAREYVTFSVIKDLEERIMKQFDRLYDAVRGNS
jgi:hypothetical protein